MNTNSKKTMWTIALGAVLCVGAGVNAPAVQAQTTAYTSQRVVLDPGTVIPVTLNERLSSRTTADGETFTANVDTSRQAYNSLMQGAVVEGVVRNATPQSGNDPGTLELAFTRLRLADGTSYVINGAPTSLDAKNLSVRSDGILVAKNTAKNKSLTYAGIGAGAAVLLNVLRGGHIRLEDILLGGGLGYAAGELTKDKGTVHDVVLEPGTQVGVMLHDRVLYHRRIPASTTTTTQTVITNPVALKYYTYHGERWSYNPVTGERVRLSTSTQTYHRTTPARKYYSYLGHPYYMDLNTGERVRLD